MLLCVCLCFSVSKVSSSWCHWLITWSYSFLVLNTDQLALVVVQVIHMVKLKFLKVLLFGLWLITLAFPGLFTFGLPRMQQLILMQFALPSNCCLRCPKKYSQ